jgi:carbon storage regulator
MLVLSRKEYESIVIGDDIVIEVISIRGDIVRIGISAPIDVPILRHELWERLDRERREREEKGGSP